MKDSHAISSRIRGDQSNIEYEFMHDNFDCCKSLHVTNYIKRNIGGIGAKSKFIDIFAA